MLKAHLSLVLLAASGASCASSDAPRPTAPVQLLQISDAYELAGRLELPEVQAAEYQDMHNVFRLSETIISGGEPQSASAFEELQAMGVKTILSVDGKVPNAELAAQYGMRYVHVPIRYKGIEDQDILRIAKTFRELESPFYVHCFHGRHRGPAAAAVGRLTLDGVTRERALAEMRQWCGTSKQYAGLYRDIASKPMPSVPESEAYAFDFPAARPMQGFRQAMVEIPRLYDNLELLGEIGFTLDPAHPDLDALHEARKLSNVFQQARDLPEVAARPADFRKWLDEAAQASQQLVGALEAADGSVIAHHANNSALDALESLGQRCSSCHGAYRNSRN